VPEKATRERAQRDRRQGKAPSTQAGEYVREEIHHVRQGKHGARSAKQAIAIGLSKARRDGVPLPARGGRSQSSSARKRPARPSRSDASSRAGRTSPKRSRATRKALEREPRAAASHKALSKQARAAAGKRRATGGSRNRKRSGKSRP
jgi:hypothetical protein